MRSYLNLLVCLAFAVRSLLPVGFMLMASPEAGGALQIVICTGHGPQSWSLDDKGVPYPAKTTTDEKSTCPYAPGASAAATQESPQLLAQTVRYAAVAYAVTSDIFRETPKPGAHSARGPPVSLI